MASNNFAVALQLALLLEEARTGDPTAQLEAIETIWTLLSTRVAYLRVNKEFSAAILKQIEAELAKKHPAKPTTTNG